MKKINSIITNLVLISLFAAIGCVTATAQRLILSADTLAADTRPFDFSDKYYDSNGVQPYLITGRANGQDGRSVFTKNIDENYSNVRLIETLPAYNYDGSMLYFNNYGELFDTGFKGDESGERAMEVADSFPMFVFPSAIMRGNRQSNIIDARAGYFTKNPLGLSLIVEVVYTDRAEGPVEADDDAYLTEMGKRNGYSLDGTPIIKTVDEVNYLTRRGIVTQKIRGIDRKGTPSYAIVKAIENVKGGAIAADAFLVFVAKPDGQPLDAENIFVENFDCLKETGNPCSDNQLDR